MAPNVADYQDILWSRSMNSCVCNTLQLSLYLYTYLTTGIGHALLMTCSGSDGLSSSTSKVCSWLLLLCLGLYFDCGFLKMGDPSVSEVSWFISVSCTNHLYTLTYTLHINSSRPHTNRPVPSDQRRPCQLPPPPALLCGHALLHLPHGQAQGLAQPR